MATKQKQSTLILIMIVLLGLLAGYFYYSNMVAPSQTPVQGPPISPRDNLASFENIRIDFNLLTNEKIQSLQVFGESPVNPGVTGRTNIFAPI